MVRLLVSIACLLLVTACAANYADIMRSYQAAPLCCRSMDEFPINKLPESGSITAELDAKSKAYLFDTGKSYFQLFELTSFHTPYRLVIESYMLGDDINHAYIFSPHVLFLDKDYKVVRTSVKDQFELKSTGMTETWGLRYKLSASFAFAEENRRERYIVILTTEELLRMKTSLRTMKAVPIILPGIVSVVPAGKEEKQIPHSPVGRITVKAEHTSVDTVK
jgi:hypothetical protein